jgi:3-deoxy-D-manno-octulosonic-acid transferase
MLRRRAARGKEIAGRLAERRGVASRQRPEGPLIWIHGASVGEGLAAVALAAHIGARRPDLSFLLTTGTATSAELVGSRLPPRSVHQFAPLDAVPWIARFLDHWRPDVCARIDSDLWPATLTLSAARAPTALVNGRISERSARSWRWAPGMAGALMRSLSLILTQDAESRARFAALGADPSRLTVGGAIKAAAPPPPADARALAQLRNATAGRPIWLAASTHDPEERLVVDAHAMAGLRGLLTVIAPRHPARGAEIAAAAREAGLTVALRSAGEGPERADVYVADTLGEMGLWYRLAPLAFIGGSVAVVGGHNPYEPAALGVALAHGPHVANFAEPYRELAPFVRRIADAADLAKAVRWALKPAGGASAEALAAGAGARAVLAPDPGPLDRSADALLGLLDGRSG